MKKITHIVNSNTDSNSGNWSLGFIITDESVDVEDEIIKIKKDFQDCDWCVDDIIGRFKFEYEYIDGCVVEI